MSGGDNIVIPGTSEVFHFLEQSNHQPIAWRVRFAARIDNGINPRHPVFAAFDRKINEHDGVFSNDTDKHQHADDDWHGESVIGCQQCNHNSAN